MSPAPPTPLQLEHEPAAIRRRLARGSRGYLASAVLGGIDGGVTTFAIVAGAVGGGLSGEVILILGFANLFADGFSMAASNYTATRSLVDQVRRARRIEGHHVDAIPEGEREEVRQILAGKGLEGEALERTVEVVTADRRLWIDMMLAEEWGLPTREPSPGRQALVTFAAFAAVGFLPLAPFLAPGPDLGAMFRLSVVLTAIAFAAVGALKGVALGASPLGSGLRTLGTGAAAALLAYAVGAALRSWVGAG